MVDVSALVDIPNTLGRFFGSDDKSLGLKVDRSYLLEGVLAKAEVVNWTVGQ